MIDLFAIVTLAGLVSAMVAPFLREMQTENRNTLFGVAIFQLVVTAGAIAFAVNQRKKLLEKSGRRIGIAYCGEIRWRLWPVIKSSIYMILLATAQLCLALVFATGLIGDVRNPVVLMNQLQLGCIAGFAFARYLWRVYPNSMEFFDNGISLHGMTFIPWAQIDLRSSKYSADRIVVVLRPAVTSVVADTKTAQVTDALRDRLFAMDSAARE